MRSDILIFTVCNLFTVFVIAQPYKGVVDRSKMPIPKAHYQDEYAFDAPLNAAAWNQKSGMHVSFGSTDELYFRTEVPLEKEALSYEVTGWKGERLNAQILVWSSDTLNQVRFRINDLVSARGKVLSAKNIKLNMVRYVLANYPYGARDVTCGVSPYKDLYLMPDRYVPIAIGIDRFNVPGKSVRPVWLSLECVTRNRAKAAVL